MEQRTCNNVLKYSGRLLLFLHHILSESKEKDRFQIKSNLTDNTKWQNILYISFYSVFIPTVKVHICLFGTAQGHIFFSRNIHIDKFSNWCMNCTQIAHLSRAIVEGKNSCAKARVFTVSNACEIYSSLKYRRKWFLDKFKFVYKSPKSFSDFRGRGFIYWSWVHHVNLQ